MPRKPSPKQSQASRENGKRTRGPTASDGKWRSARRGTKAGLRAQTVALPHEPAERSERCDQWHDHYGPRSPASIHMTNQCARMTILSDRADEYQQAELQKQVRETREAWLRKQRRRVRYLAGQIRKDPWGTVEKLKAFGGGVAFIIESFQNMIDELGNRGYFKPEGVEGVLLFFGMTPDDATICRYELAYTITLNNLGCLPDQPAPDLAKWLEPVNRPFPLRNKPREELMGADADACRAVIVKRIREELIPLRELHGRVVKDVDEPALLEALQRASILEDAAARRVARCLAEVRMTYHRAWRDLVKDLETGDQEGLSGSNPDDEKEGNDQDQDQDQDQDGEAGATAEAPAEAVIHEEPEHPATGADAVPEPGCGEAGEFLPFQPERIVERSAQLPEAVVISVEFSAARVQGAKSDLSGGEGGTNGVENRRSGPGSHTTAPAGQMGSAGSGSWASGCADQSTGGAPALTRPAADLSRGERCGALHPDPPWEELTPRARSAIEALNRDTMADITMRGEPMRSEHPLRE